MHGAEAAMRRAIDLDPANAEAHLQLGSMYGRQNRMTDAMTHLTKAVEANPESPGVQLAIGNVHLIAGDAAAAEDWYKRALRFAPSDPVIYFNLGLVAQRRFDHQAALANFERTCALAPLMPGAIKNRTYAQIELGLHENAVGQLRQLSEQRPQDCEVLFSFGYALRCQHRPELAIQYFERARQNGNADAELLLNLGIALRELGRVDEAIEIFDAIRASRPGFEQALWHRSLAYLLKGDFHRGWEHYDLRLLSKDRAQRSQDYAPWQGEDLDGSNVLVYGEQGLGDEIMFASCLPQLIEKSRRCVIECSDKLLTLFQRSFPDAVVRPTAQPSRNEAFDFQVAMGSLPKYMRQAAADFPQHAGYLRADSSRVAACRERLSALGPGLKVGISWLGGSYGSRSPIRSIPLKYWGSILQVPGVQFVDLQYSDCTEEIGDAQSRFGIEIHRWREVREDFEETAAMVCAVDLVISVCTAVIHLSGALGRPVWIMAPFSPEWRYGIQGPTMPWYPSARLFRQPAYAAWEPVIADVAKSLRELQDLSAESPSQLPGPTLSK